jgi:hypothetical protein
MRDWLKVSLRRVGAVIASTLFVFLVFGVLILLGLWAADSIIREGDLVKGFILLGLIIFFVYEGESLLAGIINAHYK